jgi:hypothetical protein
MGRRKGGAAMTKAPINPADIPVGVRDVIHDVRCRLRFLTLAAEGFDHGDSDAALGLSLMLKDTHDMLVPLTTEPGGRE